MLQWSIGTSTPTPHVSTLLLNEATGLHSVRIGFVLDEGSNTGMPRAVESHLIRYLFPDMSKGMGL